MSCQIGVISHLARQVANSGARLQAVRLAIMAEDRGASRSGPQQVKQNSDGSRLAGAVLPEESENLAAANFQIKILYRDQAPVAFGQSANGDCRGASEH